MAETTTTPALRFGVAHDFRCPPGSSYSMADVYAQTMEQIALVDRLGLDLVWFSEHHFVEAGYLPNFVPVAAAAAAPATGTKFGRYPSSTKWCSLNQTRSSPSRSSSAICSIVWA